MNLRLMPQVLNRVNYRMLGFSIPYSFSPQDERAKTKIFSHNLNYFFFIYSISFINTFERCPIFPRHLYDSRSIFVKQHEPILTSKS